MTCCVLWLLLAAAPDPMVAPQSNPAQVLVQIELPAAAAATLQKALGENHAVPPEQGETLLSFCVLDDQNRPGPPMFGSYSLDKRLLTFAPRRPLTPGIRYAAQATLPGQPVRQTLYSVPTGPAAPAPEVVQVYPSSDRLPANQLKFYLEFSQSMRESRTIFDQFHLVDEEGAQVADPWRRKELWSPDGRRLSLWIHPGRVKQGVNLREEFGPVLEPGRRYTLVVDADLRSAAGAVLGKPFRKTFLAVEPDRERPLPAAWKLSPPRVGSRDPLTVDFGEPLDQSLASRLLEVRDPQGAPLAGRVELAKEEQRWLFHPAAVWKNEPYRLAVDALLEDLAGNTPARLFETDLTAPPLSRPVLERQFLPR